jgi:hypothetical protein
MISRDDLTEFIFTRLERVALCSGLVVAGAFLGQYPEEGNRSLLQVGAVLLILGGFGLLALDFVDGIRKLRGRGISVLWMGVLGAFLYFPLALLFSALVRMGLLP